MTGRTHTVVFVTLAVAACASGGSAPLTFAPAPGTVRYERADTLDVTVDAGGMGMGSLQIRARTESLLAVELEPGAGTTRVEARFEELEGVMSNPVGPPTRLSREDVEGALVLELDGRARARLVEEPRIRPPGGQLLNPLLLANEIFPRLPARSVAPGESWSDTVRIEGREAAAGLTAVLAVTFTLAADTVVDGESLKRIEGQGTVEMVTTGGQSAGFELEQDMKGTIDSVTLWSPEASLVRWSRATQRLEGTVTLVGSGVPALPLRATGATTIRRVGS